MHIHCKRPPVGGMYYKVLETVLKQTIPILLEKYLCAILFFVFLTRMKNVSVVISDGLAGRLIVIMWQKPNCNFLRHYEYDKCQTFHDGSTHWTLPIYTTFSDLDCIWRSEQCQTVLTENVMFLSDYDETVYDCWLHEVDHEYTSIFDSHTCSREIIDMIPFLKKI